MEWPELKFPPINLWSLPLPEKTPCVAKCKLNPDKTCLGCGRTIEEIKDWTLYSDAEKRAVLERLEQEKSRGKNAD